MSDKFINASILVMGFTSVAIAFADQVSKAPSNVNEIKQPNTLDINERVLPCDVPAYRAPTQPR